MRVSVLQRKCALIEKVSRGENWPDKQTPAWPKKAGDDVQLLEITKTSFNKWIEGKVSKPNLLTLDNADSCLKRYLMDRNLEGAKDSRNLLSDEVGVMELGRFLGLTRQDCRRTIDVMIGRVAPTFSIFSHQPAEMRALERSFQGLSFVYRPEVTETAESKTGKSDNVLRMPLSVRYPIDSHKVMAKGLERLRCRLQVCAYSSAEPDHEYDGYMTKRDGGGKHNHWFFQSRIDQEADVIYMITTAPQREVHDDPESRRYILGLMFSRTQDESPVAGVWPVVIVPVTPDDLKLLKPETEHDDSESMLMKNCATLMSLKDVDAFIVDRLREAESLINILALPKVS